MARPGVILSVRVSHSVEGVLEAGVVVVVVLAVVSQGSCLSLGS